jgi:hypothetical protein
VADRSEDLGADEEEDICRALMESRRSLEGWTRATRWPDLVSTEVLLTA